MRNCQPQRRLNCQPHRRSQIAALLVLLWSAFAAAEPVRAGRVSVYAQAGLEDEARELADAAESTLARIAADLPGLPAPGSIEVRFVRDAKDLPGAAPVGRGVPPWAIGVAYPDLGVVMVAMYRDNRLVNPLPTLKHELAHVALHVALGRAPRWLHEGFAYQHAGEWSFERVETLAGMAWFGSTIPLEQLDASFPAAEVPAHRAYAQSYDFVGFLSRRGRWEDKEDDGDRWAFRHFLGEIGRGHDPEIAAQRAFGRSLKQLFDEWRQDLESRYMFMPIGLFGLGLWVLCAVLLVIAYFRKRHLGRKRIAQWDLEEAARREVTAPPYVPWTGEDPLAHDPDDDRPPPDRLMN